MEFTKEELESEEFRDIEGYEDYYQVSNLGRVKSLERWIDNGRGGLYHLKERMLKLYKDSKGYYRIGLYINGVQKKVSVHSLVFDAFSGVKRNNPNKNIDHIDNNKLNNRIDNLQYILIRDNVAKGAMQHKKTSKYTGVFWDKKSKKWKSHITFKGKRKSLGYYDSEIDAAQTYQEARAEIVQTGKLSEYWSPKFSSKYNGVYWRKDNSKWVAQIRFNKKQKYLGSFPTEEEAHQAYQEAMKKYFSRQL